MPVLGGESSAITHSFRENWLNAGGLPLIMNILLPDTLPKNADYELRQSCYYIILQLAKYVMFFILKLSLRRELSDALDVYFYNLKHLGNQIEREELFFTNSSKLASGQQKNVQKSK